MTPILSGFLRPAESPGQQSAAYSVNSAPNSASPRLRVRFTVSARPPHAGHRMKNEKYDGDSLRFLRPANP
jgi:hypothetical protein